jgi:hypothetical protein
MSIVAYPSDSLDVAAALAILAMDLERYPRSTGHAAFNVLKETLGRRAQSDSLLSRLDATARLQLSDHERNQLGL